MVVIRFERIHSAIAFIQSLCASASGVRTCLSSPFCCSSNTLRIACNVFGCVAAPADHLAASGAGRALPTTLGRQPENEIARRQPFGSRLLDALAFRSIEEARQGKELVPGEILRERIADPVRDGARLQGRQAGRAHRRNLVALLLQRALRGGDHFASGDGFGDALGGNLERARPTIGRSNSETAGSPQNKRQQPRNESCAASVDVGNHVFSGSSLQSGQRTTERRRPLPPSTLENAVVGCCLLAYGVILRR